MTLLENPPENPCFGCGPHHPRGLKLNFTREGDEVVCEHTPRDDEIGWPGVFHTGLHFMVLAETCYWGALELSGRVHTFDVDAHLHQPRLPRTGRAFRVRARIAAREDDGRLLMEAHSADAESGKPLGSLKVHMRPIARETVEKAGLKLPEYLLEQMP